MLSVGSIVNFDMGGVTKHGHITKLEHHGILHKYTIKAAKVHCGSSSEWVCVERLKPTGDMYTEPAHNPKRSVLKPPTIRGSYSKAVGDAMRAADMAAAKLAPTSENITRVLSLIDTWPTQDRPNVTPTGKPVTGFCLGAVMVLGGKGMHTSVATKLFPNLCRCMTTWISNELPGFPFSSIQVNYNYASKKHTDGNNIGPSYIISLGDHEGGGLWTADKYVHDGADIKPGGGEATLECHNTWQLFNGNAEHCTMPIRPVGGSEFYTRFSIIVFSHSSYNNIPPDAVQSMCDSGFTAQSSDGEELPYFRKFRVEKKEFDSKQNSQYTSYLERRCVEWPPPSHDGQIVVECFGLTMNRGGGWMAWKRSGNDTTVVELHANTTGLHVVELTPELDVATMHINKERFNIYQRTAEETKRFVEWVSDVPHGHLVLIGIADTVVAAKRPCGPELYAALAQLGASDVERFKYRHPFALVGVKGHSRALYAQRTSKAIVRIETDSALSGQVLTTDVSEFIS